MAVKNKGEMVGNTDSRELDEEKIHVSVRVLILSVIFIVVAAYSQYYGYIASLVPDIDWGLHIPTQGGFAVLLFAFVFLYKGLGRINKRLALSKGELILLYLLLLAGGAGVSQSSLGTFNYIGIIYRDVRQGALSPFVDRYSSLIHIRDYQALTDMQRGGAQAPWNLWMPPIITWTIFSGVIFYGGLCLAALFRKRWMDREHLLFPLTTPILAMVESGEAEKEGSRFWQNKTMWIGFVVAALYTFFDSRYAPKIWPGMPSIYANYLGMLLKDLMEPVGYGSALFGEMGTARIEPLWVGLGYLISLDLLFSTWFFFLLRYPFNMYLLSIGFPAKQGNLGYPRQLAIGSTVAIGLWQLWMMRDEIKAFLSIISGKASEQISGSDGWMSPRSAAIGFILCLTLLLLFFIFLLKVSIIWSLTYLAIFFLAMIGLSRIRSEAGLSCQAGIGDRFINFHIGPGLGSRIPINDLAGLSFLTMTGDQARSIGSMSTGLEAMKFFEDKNDKSGGKKLLFALLGAFVIGIFIESVLIVSIGYRDGLGSWETRPNYFTNGWNPVITAAKSSYVKPQSALINAIFVGGGLSLLLSYLRARFVWWPIHPMGIVAANSQMGWVFPVPFFIAWLVKFITTRYGGLRLVNKLKPFFLGLMIGQLSMQAVCMTLMMIVK